ncbi:uncharacterized protein V1513DRAFT_430754 [Lipomyces chichibuensis]|uniref:uncharacterized protein n=1 Tax=Lipomyces chichibuensis TaxID=1546026 RepID=UPI00334418E4
MTEIELPRIQEEEEYDELDVYDGYYRSSHSSPVIAKRGGTPPPPWGYRPPKPPTEFESFIRAREQAFASLQMRMEQEREKQYLEYIRQLPDIDTPPLYHRPIAEERRREGRMVYLWITIIFLISVPFLATTLSCIAIAVPLVLAENMWHAGNRRFGVWKASLDSWIRVAISILTGRILKVMEYVRMG